MAPVNEVIDADGARQQWDDNTRLFTSFDSAGNQVDQRAYTDSENADADARVVEYQNLAKQGQAQAALGALTTQITSARTQTEADRTAWATADATTRDEIMDRVFAGLENIIDALEALGVHLGVG